MGKRRTRYVSQLEAQKHKTDHKEIEGTWQGIYMEIIKVKCEWNRGQ